VDSYSDGGTLLAPTRDLQDMRYELTYALPVYGLYRSGGCKHLELHLVQFAPARRHHCGGLKPSIPSTFSADGEARPARAHRRARRTQAQAAGDLQTNSSTSVRN